MQVLNGVIFCTWAFERNSCQWTQLFALTPTGLPGNPAEPRNGSEGPLGPRGFPGVTGRVGAVGISGVPGVCEARDCSIYAPVLRKEQGLVKRPGGSKI